MKILIAGDFCPNQRVASKIQDGQADDILKEIRPIASSVDLSIVNFECPIVKEKASPIIKQGPHLKCSSDALHIVKDAGFSVVTLANNHIYDYGDQGVFDTISVLTENDVNYVGAGRNQEEASTIYYHQFENKRIAIINCCEQEFSIATPYSAGANLLDPTVQWYSIQEAKKQADYVLVITHSGHEYCQLPSLCMQQTYRFFIDCGADAVVNHHQHCYSGYENYKGKAIVYGLGNFCFDEQESNSKLWNEGYLSILTFEEDYVSIDAIPYIQCKENASVELMKDDEYSSFKSNINYLNSVIASPKKLNDALCDFYRNNDSSYQFLMQPYSNRILVSLFSRGILPNIISKKKLVSYYNYIICDSHRNRLLDFLRRNIYLK